jgi:hypothetical protein
MWACRGIAEAMGPPKKVDDIKHRQVKLADMDMMKQKSPDHPNGTLLARG